MQLSLKKENGKIITETTTRTDHEEIKNLCNEWKKNLKKYLIILMFFNKKLSTFILLFNIRYICR